MDETVTPEPVHDLLLRLAGRVDDDLLGDARELVAVGEDGRALELVTAALAADATPLPGALRAGLVDASRAARIDLDVDAALSPVGDPGDDHRFTPEAGPVDAVLEALGALPARRLEGCELRLSWRLTPAGAASGPLPHAVVLVRAGGDGPPDVLAYQMAMALERVGVHASVEVLAGGGPVPRYHAAAWRESAPITVPAQDPPGPGGSSPEPERYDDRYDADGYHDGDDDGGRWAADDVHGGVPGNGHGSWLDAAPEANGRGAGSEWAGSERSGANGRYSWADDRAPAGDDPGAAPLGLFDDGSRAVRDRGGRRVDVREPAPWGPSEEPDGDRSGRGDTRWPGAADPSSEADAIDDEPAADPGARGPAPRPLPMRPPGGRRRLVEQPGDTHHGVTPLSRGPGQGPVPIDRRRPSPRPVAFPQVVDPAEDSVPRPSRPDPAELTDTPTFAATHDALLGAAREPLVDPSSDPSDAPRSGGPENGAPPAHQRGAQPWTGGPGPARPGAVGPGRGFRPAGQAPPRSTSHAAFGSGAAPAAPAADENAWAGEWTSGDWAVADPGPAEQAAPAQAGPSSQDAGLLRPETMTRLSDADRDLLARLQAELVSGRRPRGGHQSEAGTNGAHADTPQDRD